MFSLLCIAMAYGQSYTPAEVKNRKIHIYQFLNIFVQVESLDWSSAARMLRTTTPEWAFVSWL